MKRSKYMLLALLAGSCLSLSAQHKQVQFTWEAPVAAPAKAGFYRIAVTPAIAAAAGSTTFADLRLYRGDQVQPYILQREVAYDSTRFDELAITQKVVTPGGISTYTLRAPARVGEGTGLQDHFVLQIKNSGVTKNVSISGSNDERQWYAITGWNELAATMAGDRQGSSRAMLRLPATDYAYYQLKVNDSASAPLYIEKIGLFMEARRAADYTPNPTAEVTKIKAVSEQESIFSITLPAPYLTQRIEVEVTSPALYRREAGIGIKERDPRGKGDSMFTTLDNFVLQPGATSFTLAHPLKQRQLYLFVTNGDNPPLEIRSVRSLQQLTYLVAYLEPGAAYQLKGGDPVLAAPVYDLTYFSNQLPAALPLLTAGDLIKITTAVTEGSPTVFRSNRWIWAGLILVIALLVFVSMRMLRDMKQR